MFGDGGKGKVKGVVTITFHGILVLHDVLYVEGLTANLVSISQLMEEWM